jgi:hypothetical protein
MTGQPRKSLSRALGEFVGHIARGVKADPTKPDPFARPERTPRRTQTLDQQVQERQATDERGRRVVLRRTIIDEVEYPDGR